MSNNDAPVPAADARNQDQLAQTRDRLAILVLCVAGGLILALAAAVLATSFNIENTKFVFGAIVPLLATWVGTVLAYYYTRENLAAATNSVTALATHLTGIEKLRSIPANKTMRAFQSIRTVESDPSKLDAMTLEHITAEMKKIDIGRLVVFDDKKAVRYIVHDSTIFRFISSQAISGKKASDLKFSDLTADPEMKAIITNTVATVGPDATLADAKRAMEQCAGCEDVFVTTTGRRDGEVLGWITDNQISEEAQA